MPSENMILAAKTDAGSGIRGASNSGDGNSATLNSNLNSANKAVSGTQSAAGAPVQVVSGISGVTLSAVASDAKSGIMTSKNQDVDLPASMDMVIGVSLKQ
jgi:hypothetical protein